jgi:GDP-L-fucose synthase
MHLNNEIINVSSGKDYTIREFAEMICDIVEYPSNRIVYDETKFTGVNRKTLDITNLNNIINSEFKFTALNVGIKNTIDYYLKEIYANS